MKERAFSKQSVRRQLAGEGLKPKKGLGQNFLTDGSVLLDIVEAAELDEESCVLEIGPGMGVLTRELAKCAGKVVAVEIDTTILPILEKNVAEFSNVTIINQDILKVDLPLLLQEHFGNRPVKVIANLPYYITTPIIMKLLEESKGIASIVVMIQREVADRLAAEAGSKDFGAITLSVQYRADVRKVRDVSPECFEPVPKVWSSVIELSIRENPPVQVEDEGLFFRLIKGAFAQRRKTFLNSVSGTAGLGVTKEELKELLLQLGLGESVRGESLSIEQFAQISDGICRKIV
ncbi:MAG: 16S rRNA (adenine(1518)-N(6)/adenine(1519)-N(6))-dimethyltransferase RsmA [Ruminococcaceae bacterium]|nr:16S rRNA (adenine(1518)-N(6)/adenine(1519)-N(6))-dimethyltransferase RsmA [Oscillospiraceae bacterium]